MLGVLVLVDLFWLLEICVEVCVIVFVILVFRGTSPRYNPPPCELCVYPDS